VIHYEPKRIAGHFHSLPMQVPVTVCHGHQKQLFFPKVFSGMSEVIFQHPGYIIDQSPYLTVCAAELIITLAMVNQKTRADLFDLSLDLFNRREVRF
jgi:hypothetical protein